MPEYLQMIQVFQTLSYELQKNHYTGYDVILLTEFRTFTMKVFQVSLSARDSFMKMISDCEKGNIDFNCNKECSSICKKHR